LAKYQSILVFVLYRLNDYKYLNIFILILNYSSVLLLYSEIAIDDKCCDAVIVLGLK